MSQQYETEFKDELANVKLLWDNTYIFNIKYGMIKERKNRKVKS